MPQFLPKPSFAPKPSQEHAPSLLRSLSDALAWSRQRLLLNSATVSAYQMPLKTLGAQSVMESLTATRTMLARAVLVGNAPSAILLFETSFAIGPIERGYSLRKRRQACSSLNDLKNNALLDDGQLTCLCHRTLALLLRLTWPSRPLCGRRLSVRRRDRLWVPPLHTQEQKWRTCRLLRCAAPTVFISPLWSLKPLQRGSLLTQLPF